MKIFAAFFTMMLVLLAAPVFAFESTGEASCYGNFSGSWFWQGSDSTITEKWEWKNLGSMYPYRGKSSDVDPTKVFGRVTTSQSTFGRGNVGVSADGSVSGPEYSLELGFEFKIRAVGGITGTWDSTQKSTTGSKSTTTAGSYTMSGTGQSIGVSGGGGITVEGTGFKGHGAISFSSSPPFEAPGELSVTIEKDLPKAYECSHSNCEAALPSRGYHLVTCGKNLVNHHGGVGTCREKYYICQGSCLIHGSGSGSDGGGNGNTQPTGSTPPNNGGGGNSPPPTDNTPNCQDCTSDCSSPCSCTNSGTCNGTVVDNTPNCDQCTDGCWLCMVVCSREDCSSWVLPSAPHSASCDKGHTYWPGCPANKNTWWHQSSTHTEVSCSRSGCSNKWYPCQRYTPKCKVRHGGCSAQ